MMTKPNDYDDDTYDANGHKNDIYTGAGAAPGASVLRSLFLHHLESIWNIVFTKRGFPGNKNTRI